MLTAMKPPLSLLGLSVSIALIGVSQLPAPAAANDAARGQAVYDQHCAACHGLTGDGNGPASVWLYPRPRNFSAGLFKIKSTPGQSLPTDEDLLQSVTRGLPGSSMPSFSYLTEPERRDVVQYVKHLTAYTDASGKLVNRFEEAAANGTLAKPVDVPAEPAVGVQELTLGRDIYKKMQCALCHGETGAGDGTQVPTLKDAAGSAGPPARFQHRPVPRRPHRARSLSPHQQRPARHADGSLRRRHLEAGGTLGARALCAIAPPHGCGRQ